MEEVNVVIVGAGPAGLAASACLNKLSIPNILLEREDCHAPLWKKRSYDRLRLHLGKQYCELPHMPYAQDAPTFISKNLFIEYLDNYVATFNIQPRYCRLVTSASYDGDTKKWHVAAKNTFKMSPDRDGSVNDAIDEEYRSDFLVVASGENDLGFVPAIPGLDSFQGECLHSSQYVNGKMFQDRDVLVVGSGNSGMEIAHDLNNCGAKPSIVIRGPVHVLTAELVMVGMELQKQELLTDLVDLAMVLLGKETIGDMSEYGIQAPTKGPFYLKDTIGQSPVLDVGTMKNIKDGEIKVFPGVTKIEGSNIHFENGETKHFDTIVFATGFKSTVRSWLKGGEELFGDDGMPRQRFPNHWKGVVSNIYCIGFAQKGLFGIASDSQNISNDISAKLKEE